MVDIRFERLRGVRRLAWAWLPSASSAALLAGLAMTGTACTGNVGGGDGPAAATNAGATAGTVGGNPTGVTGNATSASDTSGMTTTTAGATGSTASDTTGATATTTASIGTTTGSTATTAGSTATTTGSTATATGSTATTTGSTATTTGATGVTTGSAAGTSTGIDAGMVTAPPGTFDAKTAAVAVRKVKNLLTGLSPTDAEIATATSMGAAGLQSLIGTWLTDANYASQVRDKMVFFLRNTFQQTGFTPTEDFKMQLLQNGGFDFGPLGTAAIGDDVYYRLVQNIQDSFALTAWQIVTSGGSFADVLTTRKYLMTTALKALYLQIEMPNDQPFAFGGGRGGTTTTKLSWTLDYSGTPITIEDALNPASANYMVFSDEPPANATTGRGGSFGTTCRGTGILNNTTGVMDVRVNPGTGDSTNAYGAGNASGGGTAQLFQRLIGYTPRFPFSGTIKCIEHPSKPYFTVADTTDWQWVNVHTLASGETIMKPWDIVTLRKATDIGLALPRIGFYTTPAFLALWNTNDSNQHRVTANQTLLGALGESFTSESTIIPLSAAGLDSAHSVAGSECLGCHKSLDPMRGFWGNQLDYNDRNDFPTSTFGMTAKNPRPTTLGGGFAFANVNSQGASLFDVGGLLSQVTDGSDNLSRFAVATTQKLCFYANSTACSELDPEFRRVAKSFQDSKFNFAALVKELFSSPLITGAVDTKTFAKNAVPISISRRDHFCAALSNRLGVADMCAIAVPLPTSTQTTTLNLATAIVADSFSRGAESPVTPADPSLFYRSATEMVCENLSALVVDPAAGTGAAVYASTSVAPGIDDMVTRIMGYPPGDPHHAPAAAILLAHHDAVAGGTTTSTTSGRGGGTTTASKATTAMRSTFVLACESPTAVSFGL